MLASATGAFGATLWMWWVRSNKPDPSMMCNGMLAGLVAITAPCAFVNAPGACLIGLISGVLVVEAALFIERYLQSDDPVGAIAVHGVNGAWGCLSLGLLADGTYGDGWNGVPGTVTGLFYGNASQFVAECIGVGANIVAIGILGYVVFKAIGSLVAIYHIYIEYHPEAETAGCMIGAPCSTKWVDKLGYITIPSLALTAFVAIITLLLMALSRSRAT